MDLADKIAKHVASSENGFVEVRKLARRFRVRQQEIIEAAEDSAANGEPLDIIVGFRNHSGHCFEEKIGDYQIEWYGENQSNISD